MHARTLRICAFGLLTILAHGCKPAPHGAKSEPLFTDITHDTGVDFTHFTGATGKYYIPEIMGAGCALFDYDGDDDLDIYVLQGAPLEAGSAASPEPRNKLFRNDLLQKSGARGPLRFTDVTEEAHVGSTAYGMGCAVGDYDGDQDLDLFVTNFGPSVLYENRGDGTFRDVTSTAGVGAAGFGSSAAWLDYDRDGKLDLFVLNYVQFSLAQNRYCSRLGGQVDYCGPVSYDPATARLYHNEGGGKFRDESKRSGISNRPGNGLGVVCTDLDGDDWIDIFVANDATPNHLWVNQKDGTFVERALTAGCAVSADGLSLAGMGVAAGDFDRDGDIDLYVTHEISETNTLYENVGKGLFEDRTSRAGLATPSLAFSGFGTLFLDYDADGWLDLYVGNGSVRKLAAQTGDPRPYKQPDQLFHNERGKFVEVTSRAGLDASGMESTRGAACGDLDLDGDLDLVVTSNGGPLKVLRNDSARLGEDYGLRLVSSHSSALGTIVDVSLEDGALQRRVVGAAGSYLSSSPEEVQITALQGVLPKECRIVWPRGAHQSFAWPKGGRRIVLKEGSTEGTVR